VTGDVICLDGGMFPEPRRVVPPPDRRTPGQRRRDRQQAAIDLGQHPLAAALRISIPLLPAEQGRTCGDCALRRRISGGNKSFPKCTAHPIRRERIDEQGETHRWSEYPRASHGAGTDVQAGWPACADYQPKETDAPE